MPTKFVTKLAFSRDDVAVADKLESAFESLLRSLKVNDSVIDAMWLNEITDWAIFTDHAQDEQQLRKCSKAFGVDTEFTHQREMAKLIGAWRQAKAQSEVKTAADAAARAHGEPVTILTMDWNSFMEKSVSPSDQTSATTNCWPRATSKSSKRVSPKTVQKRKG